jgi:hypothetical protein
VHGSSLTDVVGCQPDLSNDPLKTANAVESNPAEEVDTQLYRLEDKLDDHDLKHSISIKELDADRGYSGTDNCICLDRNNQMLRADEDTNCDVFEPGFDHTQLLGLLTLSIIALLSFAVVPLAWLLYRYHRAWCLGAPAAAGSQGFPAASPEKTNQPIASCGRTSATGIFLVERAASSWPAQTPARR